MKAVTKAPATARSLHVNMALGSRSVGYHSAVRGSGPPSLHPSNEPEPQTLIPAMMCPLAAHRLKRIAISQVLARRLTLTQQVPRTRGEPRTVAVPSPVCAARATVSEASRRASRRMCLWVTTMVRSLPSEVALTRARLAAKTCACPDDLARCRQGCHRLARDGVKRP